MANIFIDGDEIAKKENIDYPIAVHLGSTNPQTIQDFAKMLNLDNSKMHLKTIRTEIPAFTPGILPDNYSNLLVFGGGDTYTVVGSNPFNPGVKIINASLNMDRNWSEELAFKSDIDALKARISVLEKQIGGTK